MTILIGKDTKVVIQGMTGTAGKAHTRTMLDFGTNIVAGTKPNASNESVYDIPVFSTVKEAIEKRGANTSIVLVPAQFAKNAALEAINAGIKLVVIAPEHVPIQDTMEIIENARKKGCTIIGPNTAGVIAPNVKCKVGFVPNRYYTPGSIGIASRSGTLLYEFGNRLTSEGLGQSTCVGVGGDSIVGTRMADVVKLFEEDFETKATLLIGEVGGTQEEEVAELVAKGIVRKPIVAYLVGKSAPKDKRMGHAGAIMLQGKETIESKIRILKNANIEVADTMQDALKFLRKYVNQ
ncbi:MAG: succinate--CoA ligase subunit alpha [Candidatus Marsarchaeota archaeon]|jgi:succinyl-CoA synthetase alpha subunit|nr:succinate--CoA ligase subunit alpha [Candidatus Marsarchaeota archaeon]